MNNLSSLQKLMLFEGGAEKNLLRVKKNKITMTIHHRKKDINTSHQKDLSNT